jgi:hypothetical protein
MATDLYSDTDEGHPVASPTYGGDEPTDDSGDTALLPTSFFPDKPAPGKVCSIRVVSVQDDQVEVAYDHKEEGEQDQGNTQEQDYDQGGAAPMGAPDYMS